jgi:hypothetical protein
MQLQVLTEFTGCYFRYVIDKYRGFYPILKNYYKTVKTKPKRGKTCRKKPGKKEWRVGGAHIINRIVTGPGRLFKNKPSKSGKTAKITPPKPIFSCAPWTPVSGPPLKNPDRRL